MLGAEGVIQRQGDALRRPFSMVGSVKVVLPGLSELHALGLIACRR